MRTTLSIAKMACSACWLLAFSGSQWHDGLPFVPPVKDIAGHNVLHVYNMNGPDWPMNMPDDVLPNWCGRRWINYSGEGIVALETATDTITDVLRGTRQTLFAPSSRLYEGRDGNLWFLSRPHIITIRCNGRQWAEEQVPGANGVGPALVMFQDREQNLWFTTRRGLVYHDGRQFSEPLRPPDAVESTYRALPFRGFERGRQPQVIAQQGESRAITEGIEALEAADGRIWLASTRAVVTFDRRLNKWEVTSLPDELPSWSLIHEGTGGAIWLIAGSGQAQMYDSVAGRWSKNDLLAHVPPADSDDLMGGALLITGVHKDQTGTMMFATSRGLVSFNPALNTWEAFTSRNSALPDSYLTGISAGRDGTIWITERSGIVVLGP